MFYFDFQFDINIEYWGSRDMITHDILGNEIFCNEEQLNINCNVDFNYNDKSHLIYVEYHNCFDDYADVWNRFLIKYDGNNEKKINDHLYLCHNKTLHPTHDIEKILIDKILEYYGIENINMSMHNIKTSRSGHISLRKANVEYNNYVLK